jgi:UDPglucose 6-dehydrogenase
MTIGFVGMTHLGLNSAVASAEKGFHVVCFDPDESMTTNLSAGILPINEPQLPELLRANADRLRFTPSASALSECDVIYVAPDVPTNDRGASDLDPVRILLDEVDRVAHPQAVIVILSQVPPGFTRALGSARRHLYYQVETLIFGRAIERALYPERFIVGCADSSEPLPDSFRCYLEAFACPILQMRYESAEFAKISINCFLVASVSTANTLAAICESIGAEWPEILPALRLDKRIGEHAYIRPGLGIAGGNLERDLATVCAIADAHGTDAQVIRAYGANSEHRKDWVLRKLHETLLNEVDDPKIAMLGLAYKENTNSIKNSVAIRLLGDLSPFRIATYDPAVVPTPRWHPRLNACDTALDACKGADACVIMTPWDEFHEIDAHILKAAMSGDLIIDPFAVLDRAACKSAGIKHLILGATSEL